MFFNFLKKKKSPAPSSEFLFLGGDGLRLGDKDLASRRRAEWMEGAFFDFSDEELSRTDKNYLGLSLDNKKMVSFLLLIVVGLGLLFIRALQLQVVRGSYYFSLAEQNRIRMFNIPSPRGIIYDVNGRALVKNVPSFAVFITACDFLGDEEKMKSSTAWLETMLPDKDFDESLEKILLIKPKAKEYFEPVLLVDGIDYQKAIAMRIDSVDFPGVNVEVTARREYLGIGAKVGAESLSHVLGYEGKINPEEYADLRRQGYLLNDFIGKTGMELSYENMLRGKYGREQIEVDSAGRAVKIIAHEDMQKGNNIFLSIDFAMQQKLEAILRNYLARMNRTRAAAVVLNPKTGKIYSLVSLPAYDNNLFAAGIEQTEFSKLIERKDKPLFNRVVSGEYPSGSIIKPVIGAAALEEKIINEHSSFLSVGGIKIASWFFPDWKAGGHGITNLRKALAESVNTFFYIVGGGFGDFEGLGVYKIKEYAEKFGLGKITGIDLPNEKSGFLPTPEWKQETKKEQWYIGDTYHLSIGQGDLLVTPIQVAMYAAAFANQGKLLKPQIVDRYFDQLKKEMVAVPSTVINENFISPENINIIRQGMRQAVTTGSAKILNSLPVSAAAKTGTAQWSTDKNPHSWFIAFAPYNDPVLVITVLVEEGGEGSAVAAPIAYEFMSWYFREKGQGER